MLLINIIFFLVFSFLLIKAIYETLWGTCLIINGLFWHAVAFFLDALAFAIRTGKKVVRLFRKPAPEPVKFSTARAINLYFSSAK